jgi:nitrogen fixation NifU-like protein
MYDLEELYQEMVLDHSRKPRNFRKLEDANHRAEGFNPLCGDQITLYLKVEGDKIADVGFQGKGCAISKASASMLTENVKGKTAEQAEQVFQAFRRMMTRQPEGDGDAELLGDLEVLSGVSQYPARIKCAILSWHTLDAALKGEEEASME